MNRIDYKIILLLILICFAKCNSNTKKKNIALNDIKSKAWNLIKNGSGVDHYFNLAYKHRKDDKFENFCTKMNELIIKKDNGFMLSSIVMEVIDSTFNGIDWVFSEDKLPQTCIGQRKMFNVCLKNKDTIFINDEPVKFREIKQLANNFIYASNCNNLLIETGKDNNKYLLEVLVPRIPVFFMCELRRNKGLSAQEWGMMFNCLHELIELFQSKINKLSKRKFNKPYKRLPFEKKSSLLKIASLKIFVTFDFECPITN